MAKQYYLPSCFACLTTTLMIKPPKKAEKPFSLVQTDVPERIAKRIARAGICSRREAEVLILAGRVKLNGKIQDTAACNVTAKDRIDVDDKRIPTAEPARLWRYDKSRGLVVSN